MTFRAPIGTLFPLLTTVLLLAAATPPPSRPRPFEVFADQYFSALYEFSPSLGTAAGFHQYDGRIEDLSAARYRTRAKTLHQLQARLDTLRRSQLSPDEQIDAAMMNGAIRSELQDIETLETWRHNPMGYVGLPGPRSTGS